MSERSEFASTQSHREAQGTRRVSMGLAFFGSFFGHAKNELVNLSSQLEYELAKESIANTNMYAS